MLNIIKDIVKQNPTTEIEIDKDAGLFLEITTKKGMTYINEFTIRTMPFGVFKEIATDMYRRHYPNAIKRATEKALIERHNDVLLDYASKDEKYSQEVRMYLAKRDMERLHMDLKAKEEKRTILKV